MGYGLKSEWVVYSRKSCKINYSFRDPPFGFKDTVNGISLDRFAMWFLKENRSRLFPVSVWSICILSYDELSRTGLCYTFASNKDWIQDKCHIYFAHETSSSKRHDAYHGVLVLEWILKIANEAKDLQLKVMTGHLGKTRYVEHCCSKDESVQV